jgi:Ca2+-binding EF-hand superfamily protein
MSIRSLFVRALLTTLPVLAVGGGYSAAAMAADNGPTPATARVYQHLLERFDANHDGLLQTSELPPAVQQRLGAADADHNGVITPEELHSFGVARRAARFARADKNADGKLVPAEVGPVKWDYLKVADANGDGAVTLDEIDRAVASGTLRGESAEND